MNRIVKFIYRPLCKKRWDIFENILRSIKVEPESWEEKTRTKDKYPNKDYTVIEFYMKYDNVYRLGIGNNYIDTILGKCHLYRPVKLKMPFPLRFKYCKVASRYMSSKRERTLKNNRIDNTLEGSKELYMRPENKRDSKIDGVLGDEK